MSRKTGVHKSNEAINLRDIQEDHLLILSWFLIRLVADFLHEIFLRTVNTIEDANPLSLVFWPFMKTPPIDSPLYNA